VSSVCGYDRVAYNSSSDVRGLCAVLPRRMVATGIAIRRSLCRLLSQTFGNIWFRRNNDFGLLSNSDLF